MTTGKFTAADADIYRGIFTSVAVGLRKALSEQKYSKNC
jgi:hypothetical protein